MDDSVLSAETWRAVPGYEGRYEASDQGRVRSLPRVFVKRNGQRQGVRGGILKPVARTVCGRVMTSTVRLGDGPAQRVGRVVLRTFVGEPPPGTECCHGDGNAENNALSNLRWGTHRSNIDDRTAHGRLAAKLPRGENHERARLTADAVRVIRAEPEYYGVKAMLARCFGVRQCTIKTVRERSTWVHVPEDSF